jgi:hypothetical protein
MIIVIYPITLRSSYNLSRVTSEESERTNAGESEEVGGKSRAQLGIPLRGCFAKCIDGIGAIMNPPVSYMADPHSRRSKGDLSDEAVTRAARLLPMAVISTKCDFTI